MRCQGKIRELCSGVFTPQGVSWCAVGLLTACFSVFMLCCCRYADDWIYMHGRGSTFYEFAHCLGGDNASMAEALGSCADHYAHSNGRMADKLLILVNLLPLWAGRLAVGLSLGVCAVALCRLSLGSRWTRRPFAVAALLWLIMLLLPWNHQFTSVSVGFNYVLSGAVTLSAVCLTLYHEGRFGWRMAYVLPFMFFAGAMHEGFSVPTFLGFMALCVSRRHAGPCRWAMLAAYAVGVLFLLSSPGTSGRMGGVDAWSLLTLWQIQNVVRVPALWLALPVTLIYFFRRGRCAASKGRTLSLLFMLVAGFAGMVVAFAAGMRGRATWYPSLLLTGMSVGMLALLFPGFFARPRRGLALMLALTLSLWLLWASGVQRRYSAQMRELEKRVLATRSPLVALDVDCFVSTPPALMQLPQAPLGECYYDDFLYTVIAMKASLLPHVPGEYMVIIPEALDGVHYSRWPYAGGGMYGRFPLYYAPDYREGDEREVTFDIGDAPLTLWNTPAKMSGHKTSTRVLTLPVMDVCSRALAPAQRRMFADSAGNVPDTLRFAYLATMPKPLQYARPLCVR